MTDLHTIFAILAVVIFVLACIALNRWLGPVTPCRQCETEGSECEDCFLDRQY